MINADIPAQNCHIRANTELNASVGLVSKWKNREILLITAISGHLFNEFKKITE